MSTAPFAHAHGPGWHTPVPEDHPAAPLLSAEAVRAHCAQVMAAVSKVARHLTHGSVGGCGRCGRDHTAAVSGPERALPQPLAPLRGRRRRPLGQAGCRAKLSGAERARIRIDLVIPSVLLDAGAGPDWRFEESGGMNDRAPKAGRGQPRPVRAAHCPMTPASPARRRRGPGTARLRHAAQGFQVDAANPLVGLAGRAALLRASVRRWRRGPSIFGHARPACGNLFDHRPSAPSRPHRSRRGAAIAAQALGPVWPGRIELGGVEPRRLLARHPRPA